MNLELKENMYVRTEEGKIFKTDGDLIYLSNDKTILHKLITRIPHDTISYKVVKASYNIIDILEVGDYVNGMEVTRISGTRYDKNDLHCYCEHNGNENWQQVMIPVKNIKSIVTKEQFEEMSYKVKESK